LVFHTDVHLLHAHFPKNLSELFAQNEQHGKHSHNENHWMELFIVTFILLWDIRDL